MAKQSPGSMLVPGDFSVEQSSIQRRREVLEALAKRAQMGEGQMVSGHYIAPHWTEALADVGAQYAKMSGNKKLDNEEAAAKDQYRAGLGDAMEEHLRTRDGFTQDMAGPMPDGSAMEPVVQKADPRRAMVEAMSSQYAPLQQIGTAEMSQLGKQTMTQKDWLGLADKYDPKSVVLAQQANDATLLKPKAQYLTPNGQVVKVGDDQPQVMGDYRDKFGAVGEIGTNPQGKPMLGQLNSSTGEAKFAPAGTTVNVDTMAKGDTAFAVKSNELAVKRLEESQAEAVKARTSLEAFKNASGLIKDLPGGLAAQPMQNVKRVLALFGADTPEVTSFEQVNQALKTAILDNAHIFGTGNGFTDKDREELARIVGADPSLSADTLRYMVNKGLAASTNTLRSHEGLVEKLGSTPGASPAIMEAFKVKAPEISLAADDFDYDPVTRRFSAKGGATRKVEKAATAPSASKLSPAEQSELNQLRKRFGRN